ncbi:MAG TPA: hypothetical protein VMX18_02870 [Candidatus Bipolaricaulota bacterium]|nr:hypothetical protein [Candidatus Bipolaricaulota bacterium]
MGSVISLAEFRARKEPQQPEREFGIDGPITQEMPVISEADHSHRQATAAAFAQELPAVRLTPTLEGDGQVVIQPKPGHSRMTETVTAATSTPTFELIDRQSGEAERIAARRQQTRAELVEVTSKVRPIKPRDDGEVATTPPFQSYNPHMWELLEHWAMEPVFPVVDVTRIVESVAPYYLKITMSAERMLLLGKTLEDEKATERLLAKERAFWQALSPKQEQPWKDLYIKGFHPLCASEADYSKNVVFGVLVLLSVFRQNYPPPLKRRIAAGLKRWWQRRVIRWRGYWQKRRHI